MKKKQSNKFQRTAKKQKNLSQEQLKKVSGGRYPTDRRSAAVYREALSSLDNRADRGI